MFSQIFLWAYFIWLLNTSKLVRSFYSPYSSFSGFVAVSFRHERVKKKLKEKKSKGYCLGQDIWTAVADLVFFF